MDSKVTFEGSGPFDLPIALVSKAFPGDRTVLLNFRVEIEPGRAEMVRIEVPSDDASDLADQISKAAVQSY